MSVIQIVCVSCVCLVCAHSSRARTLTDAIYIQSNTFMSYSIYTLYVLVCERERVINIFEFRAVGKHPKINRVEFCQHQFRIRFFYFKILNPQMAFVLAKIKLRVFNFTVSK